MKMTISKTLMILGSWAADADGRAMGAVDAFGVVQAAERARLYRGMVEAIQEAVAAGVVPVVIPTRKRKAISSESPSGYGMEGRRGASSRGVEGRPGRATQVVGLKGERPKLDVPQFWAAHGAAVEAIIAAYGLNWKTRAPFGETELVEVAAKLRPSKRSGCFIISYPRDNRFPAARFWPNGVYPDGVTGCGDYARAWSGYGPPVGHDADWHKARGYAWDGKAWVFELGLRASRAHHEAVADEKEARRWAALEAACLRYGPQPAPEPFADIADDAELAA